jgi:two-component system sensor histidine kinase KdpD
VVGSNLSARVRTRAEEASARRAELARLYDLSRDVLMVADTRDGRAAIVHAVARRFDIPFVAIAVPGEPGEWAVTAGGSMRLDLPLAPLGDVLADARRRVEFDAEARTYAGHQAIDVEGQRVALVPLRVGTRPIGVLAASGGAVDAGTLDAIGGLAAMAIERVQMLDERRSAALLKQREELKTTLLASLGHDLRTPLTAIRVGTENLRNGALSAEERDAQAQLVLAEAGRLDRLFQNLLEMARLEAGTIIADAKRTYPAEIIEAARAQVGTAIAAHVVREDVQADQPVAVDPRLTATALAKVLENAALYTPPGSMIHVAARLDGDALLLVVRDQGAGIPPGDLPHLFERFYRGGEQPARPAGTGMGLWIARGLLAAQGAQVWAENADEGGAVFTMRIPTRQPHGGPFAQPGETHE